MFVICDCVTRCSNKIFDDFLLLDNSTGFAFLGQYYHCGGGGTKIIRICVTSLMNAPLPDEESIIFENDPKLESNRDEFNRDENIETDSRSQT